MTIEKRKELWHYMVDTHGITLLESEVNDIENLIGTTFLEYAEIVDKTAIYPNRGDNIVYPIVSLAEEVGEVSQILSKAIRDKNGVIDDEDRLRLKKEIGDVLWYLTALCAEAHTTLEDVANTNYQKLMDRLIRKKLNGSGDNR